MIKLRRMVASAICLARSSAGVSVRRLCGEVGPTLTRALISSYEHGRYLPSLERLQAILRACGTRPSPEIEAEYRRAVAADPTLAQLLPGARPRRVYESSPAVAARRAARTLRQAATEAVKARRKENKAQTREARRAEMIAARKAGGKMRAIAEQFGITPQRVSQILNGG